MEKFIPQGEYENIINIVGQWKILDTKTLFELCDYKLKYKSFMYKIHKLKKLDYLKGFYIEGKRLYLYLSNKGISICCHDSSYEICDENMTHDLITGVILRKFLEYDNFIEGKMFHQVLDDDVCPDAWVEGIKNSVSYSMAIEVELTQKSQERIKHKFIRYGLSKYDYGLFITNKRGLFRTYIRFLGEMEMNVQQKIIMLLNEKFSTSSFIPEKSECIYLGKGKSFGELFG